ncbi:MAG: peptidase M3, partial [Paludibacteraceae bacterium]|nr:peptidase M3 [Paludibacteraceae bacterium]
MAQTERVNPFFKEYDTPFHTIPFDKIKNEDFLPAMREGMSRQKAEVDSIVSNPEKPTFENTIVALERSGELLDRVQLCFYNLMSAENNEELEKIAVEIAPEETEHSNYISLNEKLFERVKQVYEDNKKTNLDTEDRMLLDKTYKGFVRSGANLNEADKEKYRELSKKLNLACLTFGQNVLKATNDFEMLITDKAELGGLPEDVCLAAKERAEAKGKEGWLFDLSYPSYSAFMKFSDRRELRQKLYMGYNTKAYGVKFDNQDVVKDIVNLRREIANLLGYKRYADYVLENRMAENSGNVYDLLDQLLDGYKPFAKKEAAELQAFAKESGADFQLQAWDWSFYSRMLKEKKYD